MSEAEFQIGINLLIDKRIKLDEAIDSLGLIILRLREKRTVLEKQIEDTSVDLKNLRGKIGSVTQYIDEERKGLDSLSMRRSIVEQEADNLGRLVGSLRENIAQMDNVMNTEQKQIKQMTANHS